jgi:hypothetical protein
MASTFWRMARRSTLIWFGGPFFLLAVVLFVISRLEGGSRDSVLAMSYLSGLLGLLGASMYFAGVRAARRWVWISENGQSVEATVVGVRLARFQLAIVWKNTIYVRSPDNPIVGRPVAPTYIIHYSYLDQLGNMYKGHSGYLTVAGATPKPGDHGVARFDPEHPAQSIWIQQD